MSFVSGFASAMNSSTPDSFATAAAVSRLSPVHMIVRIPISRSSRIRSRMPGFTTSFRKTSPRTRRFRAMTSGVIPSRPASAAASGRTAGRRAPYVSIAAVDPL